jgi:thiamine pyrophosphate-dependent acetolactate synthase large subunit-like protein
MREFGAVGNGLCFAIGVAMATNDGKVVVFDGDGGLMMHVQELDTLLRYNIRILFCCFNDGGFGADFHRLLAEGVDDSGPRYGRTDLDKIARGFGVRGRTIRSLDELATAFAEFAAQDVAEVWNIQVADTVISPDMLRVIRAQTAKRLAEDNS